MDVQPQTNEQRQDSAPSHTPGPWFVNRYRGQITTKNPAMSVGGQPICYLELGNRAMPKTSDVDAALLAAAPELLQAARWLVEIWDAEHWQESDTIKAVRTAIAKAEGKPEPESTS